MSSRLDHIANWEALAAHCGYCLEVMARECRISRQHLRRYFLDQFQTSPKEWLDDLRWREAARRLARGDQPKAVSIELHFKQQSHFTKFFKRLARQTPGQYQAKCSLSTTDVPKR
jgi:AraC family transcriptional regulator